MRRRTLLTSFAVVVVILVGVGFVLVKPWAPALLTIEAHVENGQMVVDGRSSLPTGSRLYVSVTQWDQFLNALNRGLDPGSDSTFKYRKGTHVTVEGQAFHARFDIEGWPPGDTGATASFTIDGSQPPDVIRMYGPTGAGLDGPGVIHDSDGTSYLEVSDHLNLDTPSTPATPVGSDF
jgi:hypothetical protein